MRLWYLLVLTLTGLSEVVFRFIRPDLQAGLFKDSFPSFLAPFGAFSFLGLVAGIRFGTRPGKIAYWLSLAIVFTVWSEALLPAIVSGKVGTSEDAVAMLLASAIFYFIDSAVESRVLRSGPTEGDGA